MPDDGLFKPKHIAYFTSYCELCMTTWRKKCTVSMVKVSENVEELITNETLKIK